MSRHPAFAAALGLFSLVLLQGAPEAAGAAEITSPESFFGHQLGADRKLARWDRIVEYFELLGQQSDRIRVLDLGPTTDGHPFLLVIVSSKENLADLERLRRINLDLQDPRATPADIETWIRDGKAVVSQSFGLHSTEVAGAQTAPELAYDLAVGDDAETERILDEVIHLLFPCFNPDGQVMVTDWYNETLGTEFEGIGLPWLYHRYAGHDNNRDGDYLNLVESRYIAKVLYRDWKPQAYVDHHQMGSYGARIYVPPYSEPIRPWADPLLWRELSWYGAHIAYRLEQAEKPGVINAGIYPGWGHFGWHWITPFHNIAGMLTESASASLATPLFLHPEQLQGGARGLPEYEPQSTMPNPWPGGWWRQRDIVEQQKISAWAILDIAARHRETVLRNSQLKARRQAERGAADSPSHYIVPAGQHDRSATLALIDTLLLSGLEVQRATGSLEVGDRVFGAGSFVIPAAQPKRGLVHNLLGRTLYPDNDWTRDRDDVPLRPYDTATHTMAEVMGVRVAVADQAPSTRLTDVSAPVSVPGTVPRDDGDFVLDGRRNDSYHAVHLLQSEGIEVARATAPAPGLRTGDFVVDGDRALLASIAETTGAELRSLERRPDDAIEALSPKRVALYQRYRGGSMDEGWTRLLFEKFAIPYTSVHDADIVAEDFAERYDVLVLPDDSPETLKGEPSTQRRGRPPTVYPSEYMSALGDEHFERLRQFVRGGGALVALGDATGLAIEVFELKVRNAVEGLPRDEFFCPGSTLHATFETDHPLAYGMPEEGLVLFWNSPAFEITPSRFNDRYQAVVRYGDRGLLQSGWLIGEQHLTGKAAMVSVTEGDGQVVLIGFRTQHRAQTHGTFKLLFNALF